MDDTDISKDALETVCRLYGDGDARTRQDAIEAAKQNGDLRFIEYVAKNIEDNQMVWDAFLEEAQRTCSEQSGSYVHQSRKPSI